MLEIAAPGRLRFSFLIFCSESKFKDDFGQKYEMLFLASAFSELGNRTFIVQGSLEIYSEQNRS